MVSGSHFVSTAASPDSERSAAEERMRKAFISREDAMQPLSMSLLFSSGAAPDERHRRRCWL